jgi:hypothetical protein
LVNVSVITLLQRTVDDALLARVFGVLNGVIVITIALGAVLAPVAIDLIGARTAFVVTGSLLPVLAIVSWRRLSALDAVAGATIEPARTLLAGLPMFAVVPTSTLEQVAAAMHPVRIAGGDAVFRQGDSGDRFYVIADGSVDVQVDGAAKGTLWPGEYFGEIAILRDVPRTATVVAREPTELFALERDDFLAAVTGSAQSLDAAESVVGSRLSVARPGAA